MNGFTTFNVISEVKAISEQGSRLIVDYITENAVYKDNTDQTIQTNIPQS